MINDQTYRNEESEIQQIFAEAGWFESPQPNHDRVEDAIRRAIHEQVSKEAVSFVFYGFGSVLSSFAHTFLSDDRVPPEDYKL